MAEVLFAMSHDCDIVVSFSSNNRFSVQHAVVASSSEAEAVCRTYCWLAEPVPCFACCPEHRGEQHHKPAAQGMHTTHQVTEMRKWQVCLALFTVLRCELCLILWLFTGQYWVQSIRMFTARKCAMLSNALLMCTKSKFMCSYASSWPACTV